MTSHLLALSIGPVQEFIASARRTRDLWFGSYLLSEISKAAAREVREQGGQLIFPSPERGADLEPDSTLNVANIIVAELPTGDPAAVAAAAKKAAQARWLDFATVVFQTYQSVIVADIWADQVEDAIEFYAAWHPYSLETYQSDRRALMRLLASRKSCRDFLKAKGRAGVPKSSLDGLRETVLRPRGDWFKDSLRRLRVREGEQLDAIGLVKRAWNPKEGAPRYPSVSRVAADPWLRGIGEPSLKGLRDACSSLGDILNRIELSKDRGHPQYKAFPFEGTAVFRTRYPELCEEAAVPIEDLDPLSAALAALTRDHGEPSPYLGVLVADGDRMGQAIAGLHSPDEHRDFSQALAGFAGKARRIVDEHQGVLVYAGGDDVLAFVPVDQGLACSRALHDAFGEALQDWSKKVGTPLTLSVGLAIAHFMEPLEDLLGYGRAAEEHAKRPREEDQGQTERDGLAVHVLKRGGGPLGVRGNWSLEPDKRLRKLADWIAASAVPSRVAYDLRKLADLYEQWPAELAGEVVRRDTLAVMKGKERRDASRMDDLEEIIQSRVTGSLSLRGLANELLVARQLAVAIRQAPADGIPAGIAS